MRNDNSKIAHLCVTRLYPLSALLFQQANLSVHVHSYVHHKTNFVESKNIVNKNVTHVSVIKKPPADPWSLLHTVSFLFKLFGFKKLVK